VFGAVSAIVIFGALYYISQKFLSIDGKSKIVYSLSLAILLNPVWLFYTGILS
jgi:O-antigen/teichoic acid export membrane protein